MGVVYKAEDTRLERHVALKFYSEKCFENSQALERFQREARASSALNHPNICTIHDIGEFENRPFIVMEYMEGQTLKDRLNEGPLSLPELRTIAQQLAAGLQVAHSRGIVHRDIKPANVFLTPEGQVKILDFGLAKLAGLPSADSDSSMPTAAEPDKLLTTPGTTMGTVAYMSPEQASGKPLDVRTDLFSLGVVLYEMATGSRPFKGETAAVVFKEILTHEPIPPAQLNQNLPLELGAIISKMLEKDRSVRYQSAGEVVADLRRLQRDADSGRLLTSTTTEITKPWLGSRRWLSILAVLMAVVLLGWWLRDSTRPLSVPNGDPEKSVVVLPFENLKGNGSDGSFEDGLTDAVINQLSRIGDLKVISRKSSMRYKASNKSIGEIADELGVATVLEGTVQREGNRVRINAQLVDAESDKNLWADSYDVEVRDILSIQSDLAQRISSALRLELSPQEKARLGKPDGRDPTAEDHYMRAHDYFRLGLLEEAQQSLNQVKELDPLHFSYPQLMLARIFESTEDWEAAILELEEFLDHHPDSDLAPEIRIWKETVMDRRDSVPPSAGR